MENKQTISDEVKAGAAGIFAGAAALITSWVVTTKKAVSIAIGAVTGAGVYYYLSRKKEKGSESNDPEAPQPSDPGTPPSVERIIGTAENAKGPETAEPSSSDDTSKDLSDSQADSPSLSDGGESTPKRLPPQPPEGETIWPKDSSSQNRGSNSALRMLREQESKRAANDKKEEKETDSEDAEHDTAPDGQIASSADQTNIDPLLTDLDDEGFPSVDFDDFMQDDPFDHDGYGLNDDFGMDDDGGFGLF